MKSILLGAVLLLSLSAEDGAPESGANEFDFRKTIAIYHMVEGGGIIYKRPWEYYEKHGFIIVYEALDQYLAELENPLNQNFMQPDGLPMLDEFVFVNDVAQKTYVLKEYWFGDGENWVPMSHGDYMKLRSMIDDRRDLGGSVTRTEALSAATAQIHNSAQNADSAYGWKPDAGHPEESPAEMLRVMKIRMTERVGRQWSTTSRRKLVVSQIKMTVQKLRELTLPVWSRRIRCVI